ncbi:hypothetical protein BLNAU_11308 [Blattamonas nauphoetae]|uniref:Uncharacterized protein n=1 Tax=Blattamonas nauphoetae TaxID=2049346 RepID=A0ABQ9XMX4_9EUKA|nr:hypothetical protein BLNAU_11308 [Blattamonas nauphoetae]
MFYSTKQRMLHRQQPGRPRRPGRLTPEELDQLTNTIIEKLGSRQLSLEEETDFEGCDQICLPEHIPRTS